MFGSSVAGSRSMGLLPCTISWLFRMITQRQEDIGARFSVRVSAVELTNREETLQDLLATSSQSGFSFKGLSQN
ncbi:unnamed protein product [Protopolystoma xenopodis]|uniref:Kinesin motor domain-containing protein n=1 Tax=Protopolystoma xenopodis TaxID=117903 RepID=A0A3S5B1G2_9PLAT|nr:unnamed protein product [Protopolystoma xenopodis]